MSSPLKHGLKGRKKPLYSYRKVFFELEKRGWVQGEFITRILAQEVAHVSSCSHYFVEAAGLFTDAASPPIDGRIYNEGRPSVVTEEILVFIFHLALLSPGMELAVYCYQIRLVFDIEIHPSTICRVLRKYGWRLRKCVVRPALRYTNDNLEYTCKFLQWLLEMPAASLARLRFLDETRFDRRNIGPKKIRQLPSGFGVPVAPRNPTSTNEERIPWTITGITAFVPPAPALYCTVIPGGSTSQYFRGFLINCVYSQILRPNDILVMDNVPSHGSGEADDDDIYALLAEAGILVVFCPKYSPEYNVIEYVWNTLKAYLRKFAIGNEAHNFACIVDVLQSYQSNYSHMNSYLEHVLKLCNKDLGR